MKILMVGEAANHRDKLARHLSSARQIEALPREASFSADFDDAIGEDDVVIALRLRREGAKVPPFRLLHVPGAGLDAIDLEALPASTAVCNVFEHEVPIAEFVLGAMLQWEIRFDVLRRSFSPDNWSDVYRTRIPHGELYGKTLLVLGFGRIGRAIAARARAFGMHILAVDAYPVDAPGLADASATPDHLAGCLGQADYVVISCPLTPQTTGLISERELTAMKPGSVLVNVSRAEIVDEQALFVALKIRAIAGAFLDVWYSYPQGAADRVQPSSYPFHELENVICTPHSSAWTVPLTERRYAFIARNIERLIAGEPLANVVREPAGSVSG